MNKIRPEVQLLVQDRRFFESCDENAAKKFAKVELAGLHLKGRKVPSMHLSWRQVTFVSMLNQAEEQLLMAAGFDVRVEDEYPYVRVLEKKFRHRYLCWVNGGWCLSTAERGDNLQDLVPADHTIIPTLDLPPEAGPIIGLHDLYRTLKEDLKKHGIFTEFFGLQEHMFQIMARLVTEMRQTQKPADSPRIEGETLQLGRAMLAERQ